MIGFSRIAPALCGAALAGAAALAPAAHTPLWAQTANWNTEVELRDDALVVGNPQAAHTLTEFVSYTCDHCANFTRTGEGTLQLAFVGPGHMQRVVRSIVRNPIDLTVTMLAQCGPSSRYLRNHTEFMTSQDEWLPVAREASAAQRARWSSGTAAARRQAIATDLGFYRMMERRGYRRGDIDRCLADDGKAAALIAASQADMESFAVRGTPSFAVDGTLLPQTHNWADLEPQLVALYKQR